MILIVMAITSSIFRRRGTPALPIFSRGLPFHPQLSSLLSRDQDIPAAGWRICGRRRSDLESSHINFGRLDLVLGHGLAQALKGAVVEDKVVCEFYQNPIAQ